MVYVDNTGVLANLAVVPGLQDFQFELDGYRWGIHMPVSTDAAGFNPGSNGWATQDQQSSITGATMMGRDVRTAQSWSWMLHVDQDSPETAMAELSAMGERWFNGVDGYLSSKVVKMLRYRIAGRTRVIFGRPRNFDYGMDNRLLGGYIAPSATFQKADALHYDDEEMQVDMRLGKASAGGVAFAASFPLNFVPNAEYVAPWLMNVGGNAPTAPRIKFTGPVTNPAVQIGGFKMAMSGTLPEGGTATIDCRPWSMDVARTGPRGTLALTADTRLARGRLNPGSYSAIFTGSDSSGTARCQIFWRNAWHTL